MMIQRKLKVTHNMNAQHEVLQLLQEECAEVIQAASKCIRFGEKDNTFQLEKEIGDLFCILEIMHSYDMFSYTTVEQYTIEKKEKLKKYSNLDL
jgi:hypothetical protein